MSNPTYDTREETKRLIERLFPICRSITGNGVRETLGIINEIIPVNISEIPTGTNVFDWSIPKEWNIRGGWIKDTKGEKIIDFKNLNLHVLNYSLPVHKKLSLDELKSHIFSDPAHPDWTPYRTSYYRENWGFCMSHNQLIALKDDEYEVFIDSDLSEGSLTYGECFVPGEIEDEIFFSCHICHPSLANDNLTGIAIATRLARLLKAKKNRYSYRFVFVPGTIGAIAWLFNNKEKTKNIRHGLVLSLLGDKGGFTYKKPRRSDAALNRYVELAFSNGNYPNKIIDFYPYGYDERQYCSPGFNLPVGCLMRTPFGQYPEYHTSADNLSFISFDQIEESFVFLESLIYIIENDKYFVNLFPECEPQLGKRGLYEHIGGGNESQKRQLAMLWVLNLSDGQNSLLDIAERSQLSFKLINEMADILYSNNLLKSL